MTFRQWMGRVCAGGWIGWVIGIGSLNGCTEGRYFGGWTERPHAGPDDRMKGSASSNPSGEGVATSGTQPGAEPANLLDSPPESIDARDPRVLRLVVHLDVLRVEVPMGSVSTSASIWSHLDEQAIGTQRAVTLRRNGFRVGVGRPEGWEPIKAILDGIPAPLIYHESVVLGTGGLSLDITEIPEDQAIFFFRDDGTLTGESFPASRNALQVMYEIAPDDPGKVVLKLIPEIRQHERGTQWVRRDGRYVRVPVYHGRILSELAMTAALPAGWFLAVGPGGEVALGSIVGRALLTRQVEGKRYESIYFFTPQVQRTGTVSGRSTPVGYIP